MTPSEIIEKIENSPHEELNLKEYKNKEHILNKIANKRIFLIVVRLTKKSIFQKIPTWLHN